MTGTTSLPQVPPLGDVRVTDAVFGQQSDLYKNATKHLKAENRLSTALVRHSVVLGRIQDNVRSSGSGSDSGFVR